MVALHFGDDFKNLRCFFFRLLAAAPYQLIAATATTLTEIIEQLNKLEKETCRSNNEHGRGEVHYESLECDGTQQQGSNEE